MNNLPESMADLTSSESTSQSLPAAPDQPIVFPMSFAQQRLWFLDQLEPGMSIYNVPEAMRLNGPLVTDALERSIQEIVARHESLRTRFAERNGEPVEIVDPSLTLNITFEDLTSLASGEREQEARRRISDEANRPFDLENGPLLRVTLFRLTEDDHILFLNMHHIVWDGWSMGLFLREFNALYNAFAAGQLSPLPELEIRYGDYAIRQREGMQGEERDRLLDYWKKQLEGAPAVLDLPSDRPRPARQSHTGTKESYLLPLSLKTALRDFCRAQGSTMFGTTMFMTLCAGFKTLLARYTGQSDVVVGMAVAGRGAPQTQDLIGFFTNTVVLRTDLSGDPSFREATRLVRGNCLGAFDHQDLPFELLVEALKPERSLAYSPLFQVMLSYQNTPREELHLTGIQVSPFSVETRTSMFDLTLYAWERPDGVLLTLEYNTDLFERTTIQRLFRHFEILLAGAVANPDAPISQLPLLDDSERQRVLVEWNSPDAERPGKRSEYPAEIPLQHLIEANAERRSSEVAVTYRDQRLTYGELNARANQLAAHLVEMQVGPNVLVGVCIERSLDLIIAVLAIVKSGGAYVPLDPGFPDDRIASLVEDASLKILITDPGFDRALSGFTGQILRLDWSRLGQNSAENCAIATRPQDLAYVLYTSGSTGRPKGVLVSRGALLNLLWSMRSWYDLTATDVFLGITTISFDIAGVDVWLPLLLGARLVLADRATAADGDKLQEELKRNGITFMQATPVSWKLMLSTGWQGDRNLKAVCTGEAMPRELARQLFPLVPHLWNMYGPTETTIWSTGYKIPSADVPILIGRPIANTQTYILDGNRSPVPIGVAGELYIGGDGLAEGYLNRPELTSERFVPNPFSSTPSRLYRTGDLARYLPDGNIQCLGRNDDQIKLRGFRIEPEEIRAVLMQHPAVRDAIAILDSSPSGEMRIVAYVCARQAQPEISDLRTFLEKRLPTYMVPSVFVAVDQMPLTPNGKINRQALPAPDLHLTTERELAAARNPFEARLVSIWEDVLKVKPIGIRDNYFDLGGYSLLAVKLFSEIKKAFDLELPLATLYSAPTIEALADVLERNGESALWSSLVPIRPSGSRPPFYLVSGVGGGVLVFRDLAVYLGADHPVFALQPSHPGKNGTYPTSVAAMAAGYIAEIQAAQPEGPYYLGGYSLGGFIAFEMAQQLTRAGHEVAFLAVFDAHAPIRMATSNSSFLASRTLGSRTERLWRVLLSKDRGMIIKRWSALAKIRMEERLARLLHRPLPAELTTLKGSQGFAGGNYIARPYSGFVTLFRSMERPPDEPWSYELGWEKLAAGVEVHEVPGNHLTIYSGANIAVLGSILKSCLDRVQPTGKGEAQNLPDVTVPLTR